MTYLLSETWDLFLKAPYGTANNEQNGEYIVNYILHSSKLLLVKMWL